MQTKELAPDCTDGPLENVDWNKGAASVLRNWSWPQTGERFSAMIGEAGRRKVLKAPRLGRDTITMLPAYIHRNI